MTPTARTLAECRKRGWLAHVVEKWIPRTKRRNDVFGFGDILAIDDEPGSLLIQATTNDHVSHRVTKIREECTDAAMRWIEAGNRVQVWGFSLKGARGERKLWTLRIVEIGIADGALVEMREEEP